MKQKETLEELLKIIFNDHLEAPSYDLTQLFIIPDHSDFGYNFNVSVKPILTKIRKNFFNDRRINASNINKIILQSVVNNIKDGKFDTSKACSELKNKIK